MSDGGSVTWSLEIVSGSTVIASGSQVVIIEDKVEATQFNGGTVYYQNYGSGGYQFIIKDMNTS